MNQRKTFNFNQLQSGKTITKTYSVKKKQCSRKSSVHSYCNCGVNSKIKMMDMNKTKPNKTVLLSILFATKSVFIALNIIN